MSDFALIVVFSGGVSFLVTMWFILGEQEARKRKEVTSASAIN